MMLSLLVAAAFSGAEIISEMVRPSRPDGLSGISRIDDAHYLAVDDSDGRLVTLEIACAKSSGKLTSCAVTNEVRLAGVTDGEGIAYDPLRRTVWVADEYGAHNISEHGCKTGKRLVELKLPEHFARSREGVGIESLTIAPNGLTMWTATEEAVNGDGGKASRASGTVVRLQRFSRASGRKPWKPSGQFAYVVDPLGGENFRKSARSGLSDLCALDNGTLIALEREFSVKGFLPSFRLRLYEVELKGATDTHALPALAGQRFTPVAKTLLLDCDTGFAMYEGLCVGPKMANGSQTLLLISDGDDEAIEMLMNVRLEAKSPTP